MTDILQQDIQYMAGVGPNRKKVLSEEHQYPWRPVAILPLQTYR